MSDKRSRSVDRELALCASRRVGHTWNNPDNQHWESAEPIRQGRRVLRRARCVSTCDRCQSQRIEPFIVDLNNQLAEKTGTWYRHSEEYRTRDRLSSEQMNWTAIPESIRDALGE